MLLSQKELETLWGGIRKAMGNAPTQEVTEAFIEQLVQTKTNDEFINYMRNKIWI